MVFTDDIGRKVTVDENPGKIVSLVPSITETVDETGKADILKGVTRFCIHPGNIRSKATVVGGTKDFKSGVIESIGPHLILAEKSENDKEKVLELAKKFPVFVFDITDFASALKMIETLGKLLNAGKASVLKSNIETAFENLPSKPLLKKSLYLIWKKPWMAAGQNTFTGSMMEKAGFVSVVKNGYPAVDKEMFDKADVLLLSSEPYPFKEKDAEELKKQYPGKEVLLVDGEMFSWYGVRMLKAADYFKGF